MNGYVMYLTINDVECVIDRGFVRQGNEIAASLRTVLASKGNEETSRERAWGMLIGLTDRRAIA